MPVSKKLLQGVNCPSPESPIEFDGEDVDGEDPSALCETQPRRVHASECADGMLPSALDEADWHQ